MDPLGVSVVIPTYNRAALVSRAVDSALRAISPGDEIIVVDDASTDDTERALAAYGDRIRYQRVPHRGAGAARNFGISVARNPLVAFLDSDDEWMPHILTLERALLQARPDVLFCCSNFAVRAKGMEKRRYLSNWFSRPCTWDELFGPGVGYSSLAPLPKDVPDFSVHIGDFYLSLVKEGCVCTITVLVRRESAAEALRFAEDLPTYEDWECFARVARVGLGAYLDCETAWNYGHSGPRLTDAEDYDRATTRLTIYSRVWGHDRDFLSKHSALFEEAVRTQRLIRARAMLRDGRRAEARDELRLVKDAPLAYRAASLVPGWLFSGNAIRSVLKAKDRILERASGVRTRIGAGG